MDVHLNEFWYHQAGTKSFLTWGNPRLVECIKAAFGIKDGEELVHLYVKEDGLTAIFQKIW